MRLATLQVIVPVRNAQMADPELASALALFRRAANVVARLEDAVVFRGLEPNPTIVGAFAPPAGLTGLPGIWQITGAQEARGNLACHGQDRLVDTDPGDHSRGKRPRSSSARYPRPLADWKRRGHSVRLRSCLVNNCFLSLRLRSRGRSSCRRTASSHSWAAAHCCVPRHLNRLRRRGRGARRRADRAGRRHGHEPAVPAGQRRTGFSLSRIREDCASHQGADAIVQLAMNQTPPPGHPCRRGRGPEANRTAT